MATIGNSLHSGMMFGILRCPMAWRKNRKRPDDKNAGRRICPLAKPAECRLSSARRRGSKSFIRLLAEEKKFTREKSVREQIKGAILSEPACGARKKKRRGRTPQNCGVCLYLSVFLMLLPFFGCQMGCKILCRVSFFLLLQGKKKGTMKKERKNQPEP